MEKEHHYHLTELGLSLLLTSFPMAMYFRIYVSDMPIGNYSMLLGMILLFPYRNFMARRVAVRWDKDITMLIVFHLIALFYYSISDFHDSTYPIFHYLVLLLCVSLTFTRFGKDLDLDYFIMFMAIESFICVVLSYNIMHTGLAERLNAIDRDERIFNYLTPGDISVTNIACCIFYLKKSASKAATLLLFACIFFDFLVITMTHKRTPFIVAAVIFIIFIYQQFASSSRRTIVLVALTLLLIYVAATIYGSLYAENISHVYNGVEDFINGTNRLDDTNSASQRYFNRKHALEIMSQFTTTEYIFGKGYMTLWFDNPLLQSYLDMGIYGFLSVLYFIVFTPIKVIFSRAKRDNAYIFWTFCIASYAMIGCLSTGHPYNHSKWVPVCLLLFTAKSAWAQRHHAKACSANSHAKACSADSHAKPHHTLQTT